MTLPLLDQGEEARLARLIEAGVAAQAILDGDTTVQVEASRAELELIAAEGRQSRERFLMSNVRLVPLLAGPAARKSGVPLDDLFQEGFLAMSRALQTFDPARARFATYALPRINDRVEALAASRNGAAGVPVGRARQQRQAHAIAARIQATTGQAASLDDIGHEMTLRPRTVASLLANKTPVLVGDDRLFGDLFTPTGPAGGDIADDEDALRVGERLAGLDGRTRRALELRYGLGGGGRHDFTQIAQELGVSVYTASRLCRAGIETLRGTPVKTRGRPPAAPPAKPAASQALLNRIGHWADTGLSLVEVGLAMGTRPATVYQMCRDAGREDILARLTRAELAMTGPRPPGTNILEEAIRRDTNNRAKAATDNTTPVDNDLAVVARLAKNGFSLIQVAQRMRVKPAMLYAVCQEHGRHDIVTRFRRIELRRAGPDAAGTDVLAEAVRRDAAFRDPARPKPQPAPGRPHPLPAPPAWQPPAPAAAASYARAI